MDQADPAFIYPVTGASRPACWPPVAGCLRLLHLQTVVQLAAVHARPTVAFSSPPLGTALQKTLGNVMGFVLKGDDSGGPMLVPWVGLFTCLACFAWHLDGALHRP